jgi:hypothetical protein
MKSLISSILFCCVACAAQFACADDSTKDTLTGRVQAIYVRMSPGVFRETRVSQRSGEVWAEVKTYELPGTQVKGAVLMIRTSAAVERGDIVAFRPADETYIPIAPMPPESRIVSITAKRGSAVALLYGSAAGDSAF